MLYYNNEYISGNKATINLTGCLMANEFSPLVCVIDIGFSSKHPIRELFIDFDVGNHYINGQMKDTSHPHNTNTIEI
jgi:hypothetical protein